MNETATKKQLRRAGACMYKNRRAYDVSLGPLLT